MRKFVLTGGPGVGKSTLLNSLKEKGYSIVEESARIIIEEELRAGTDILPWGNISAFQKKVLVLQLQAEAEIPPTAEIVFLDRGLLDGVAYYKLGHIEPANELLTAIQTNRYNNVFLLDMLPTFSKDTHRRENSEEQRVIHEAIENAYYSFGYTPIRIPPLTPKERTDYVLTLIK